LKLTHVSPHTTLSLSVKLTFSLSREQQMNPNPHYYYQNRLQMMHQSSLGKQMKTFDRKTHLFCFFLQKYIFLIQTGFFLNSFDDR